MSLLKRLRGDTQSKRWRQRQRLECSSHKPRPPEAIGWRRQDQVVLMSLRECGPADGSILRFWLSELEAFVVLLSLCPCAAGTLGSKYLLLMSDSWGACSTPPGLPSTCARFVTPLRYPPGRETPSHCCFFRATHACTKNFLVLA